MKKLILIAGILCAHLVSAQNSWNGAAIFNGTCYYSSLDPGINGTTGEMTVEFWIKINSSSADYAIIGKNQFRIMTSGNLIRVQVNGSTLCYSVAKLDSGAWTHVAVSFSAANNNIKIYLNGTLDNTFSPLNETFTATSDSLIIGENVYVNNLVGELDEVRIWQTVRTAAEIQNNYRNHIGWYDSYYYDANLIFCQTYDFDVYSTGVYFPYGGDHGNFGSDLLGASPSKTVMHNNSMYFTGLSYLETHSANDPNISLTGNMTAEAWIYPTSIGTTQTLLDLTSGGTGGYKLQLESTGKISWTMNQIGTGSTVLTANQWYHIAVVCDTPSGGNQVANIYINGQLDAVYNFGQLVANTGKLRIGVNQSTANYFNGFIDEVRISNFSKTPAEIQRNLHTPILYINQPALPLSTVAYNLDGNIYSGTRLGSFLMNNGCRFSYASEPLSPMFHLGDNNEAIIDSFVMKHPFLRIPTTGTAGYTYDTLQINSSITLDENNIKVFISLNHALISDLTVELFSPEGDSVMLVNRISGREGITFVLDNQTTDLVSGQFTDLAPRIGSANPFSIFNGKNSNGVWKLKITDLNNGNTGILNSWGLLVSGAPYSNAVREINRGNDISIFPNPTNTKNIYVKSSSADFRITTVQVLDLTGQIIYQSGNIKDDKNIQLNLPEKTAAGSYIVVATNGTDRYQSKLILY